MPEPTFSFEMSLLLAYFNFGLRLIIVMCYHRCSHSELASASGFAMLNRPKDPEQSKLRPIAMLDDHHYLKLGFRLASSSDSTIPTSRQKSAAMLASSFAKLQNQARG